MTDLEFETDDVGDAAQARSVTRAIVAFLLVTLVASGIWVLASEGELAAVFLIPVLQWGYVIPILIWAAITRRTPVAAVFAIGAGLLMLLGGAGCFAYVAFGPRIGG